MPKMKTKKAAAKRFRVGGTGRVVQKRAGVRHNTGKKPSKQTRGLKGTKVISGSEEARVKGMLPYHF